MRPKRSKPPLMGIPMTSAITVTRIPVMVARTIEAMV